MAVSVEQFTKCQFGLETTKGTLVAATRIIEGDHNWMEEQDFYRSQVPRGILAPTGGAGVITRKGVIVELDSELTFEEILLPLLTGVKGAVTPTAASSAQTWVFTPQLTTAVRTIDAATLEGIRGDGTTNHFYGEAGYGMTESFAIEWPGPNEVARLKSKMFARARQSGTATGSLTAYSTREVAVTNLLSVALDTSWAGLGGTAQAGIVQRASLEITTGLAPDYKLDGRADRDFTLHKVRSFGGKLSFTLQFDANAASAWYAAARANSLVYIRLLQTGTAVSAAVKTVQVDGAWRFASMPTFAEDDGLVTMTADLELVYDATGTKAFEITVINALAAVA